jgi:hypothetical protein
MTKTAEAKMSNDGMTFHPFVRSVQKIVLYETKAVSFQLFCKANKNPLILRTFSTDLLISFKNFKKQCCFLLKVKNLNVLK